MGRIDASVLPPQLRRCIQSKLVVSIYNIGSLCRTTSNCEVERDPIVGIEKTIKLRKLKGTIALAIIQLP